MCTRCISFINMVRLVRITRRMYKDIVISLRNEQYKGVLHHYFRRINQYPSLCAVRDAIFHELLIMRVPDGRFISRASDGDYYIVAEERVKLSK